MQTETAAPEAAPVAPRVRARDWRALLGRWETLLVGLLIVTRDRAAR